MTSEQGMDKGGRATAGGQHAARERSIGLLADLRQAGGAIWLWLAVAGLWSTLSPAHEAGPLLVAAAALLAAALPGADRRLVTLAAVWTVLAAAASWQPRLGLGTLAWSVVTVLALRLVAWPAWRQPELLGATGGAGAAGHAGTASAVGTAGVAGGAGTAGGRRARGLQDGRAAAFAFIAGAGLYMFSAPAPAVSWGMFIVSLAIGGIVWYVRRDGMWAAAFSLVGGWLLHLAGDVLITDQLWQGIVLGIRPRLAWQAVVSSMAGAGWLIGLAAALPQAGLDWPVRRSLPAAAGTSAAAATATADTSASAGTPANAGESTAAGAPQGVAHRGTIIWAVLIGLVAVLVPEFGGTWLRVADGGVWAASLAWWGFGAVLSDRWPAGSKEGARVRARA